VSVDSGTGATSPDRYRFAPDLPLEPIAQGTSIVVRGDPTAAPGELALRLLAPSSRDRGGTVLIDTDDAPRRTVTRWTQATDVPVSRLAVVGCDGGRDEPPEGLGMASCVSQPSDLTGLGIQYSKLARAFTEGPRGRLRVGLDSVSTLLMYCDDVQTVYRFVHTFTGRLRSTGQLGVFVINPAMHDDRVSSVVTQPFDGTVDVRLNDDGTRECRVSGLLNQPSGWTTLRDESIDS
jgi:KaiC/GvpD/RAD55 family RecA-like ATPase